MNSRSLPARLPAPLALIGGNEDRLTPGPVLRELVATCRAARADAAPPRIVVLSTASGEPELLWSQYEPAFRALGATPSWLDPRDRAAAGAAAALDALRDADLLFLTGGDQERLVDVLADTPMQALIHERHAAGELAVAGTSAGASALGAHMPVGDLNEQFAGPAQPLHRALGLMPALVVDQHFAQRKRHARLLQLVSLDPRRTGVGIDEDTALIVRPDVDLRVVGAGAVTVVDGSRMTDRREPGDIVAFEHLGLTLLPAGTTLRFEDPPAPPHLRRLLRTLASAASLRG
ncbi:cyanophycinase [Mitsuaria sp. GD03876]|uniref:cyanophycinase n=1 Tax=Mitsuaria sp. GD03876 TaxID=2975399 RepID=UPI002447F31A|nr:cyanophycinase [Mitsuaria sp. GD03876]MDH0866734.1 cyanophycinase [Mitsuaria sp. GD03876]